MTQGYLQRLIRKNALYKMAGCLVYFMIMGLVLWQQWPYLPTLYGSVSSAQSAKQVEERLAQNQRYISLEHANFYFMTDVVKKETRFARLIPIGQKIRYIYTMVEYKDGYFLAQVSPSFSEANSDYVLDVSAEAKLDTVLTEKENKVYHKMISYLADYYGMSEEEMQQYAPPMLATVEENGRFGDQLSTGIFGAIAFISLIFLLIHFAVLLNYKLSKIYRQLSPELDAEEVEYRINSSAEQGRTLYLGEAKRSGIGTGLISQEYVVAKYKNKYKVFLTKDLLWAYQEEVKIKKFFLTVNKYYDVHLYFQGYKKPAIISIASEEEAEELLTQLENRLHILRGYQEDWLDLFEKNQADFLHLVQKKANTQQPVPTYFSAGSKEEFNR